MLIISLHHLHISVFLQYFLLLLIFCSPTDRLALAQISQTKFLTLTRWYLCATLLHLLLLPVLFLTHKCRVFLIMI